MIFRDVVGEGVQNDAKAGSEGCVIGKVDPSLCLLIGSREVEDQAVVFLRELNHDLPVLISLNHVAFAP